MSGEVATGIVAFVDYDADAAVWVRADTLVDWLLKARADADRHRLEAIAVDDETMRRAAVVAYDVTGQLADSLSLTILEAQEITAERRANVA